LSSTGRKDSPVIAERKAVAMKRSLFVLAVALVAAGVAVAAVTRRGPAGPPTAASLTPAYVQAAKYWSTGPSLEGGSPARAATQSPPTTSSLMDAYVQAAKQRLP
jgi:hypothetical protein